ncbi:universal stress protein [Novosphingobium flavum]|uniref:Universal stress protein n=1 Tax=Novosphingobium aerophilum TaxID=2839843 RepID=A0A7X1KDD2_9SPHN|nr:universal stress protein [Novosphingobium aerophilum]MBC2653196.1 universal stress protein [Novosphingobium aerophilum]MBC2662556.1 universal stress protein [Novosphingobium aerophilum]
MRSILVDARPGPAGRNRIETALALARHTGGHVTLVVDTPVDRFVAIDGMGGSLVSAEALRDVMAEDDAFAAAIDAQLARQDVCCDVVRADCPPVDALAAAALLADVVVVPRQDAVAADLPLAIRGPVLAVNDDRPLAFPLGRVAVAWDGGASAAHALRASVPLLATAGAVTVLVIETDPAGFPATDVASYLARHGISAELRPLPRQGSVEATLTAALAADRPDLLVMGAYGHGRLRAFLFGGVTEHFLASPDGPALLLAH